MATDKKSDHYTSPDNYKDIDGNMKTFTYVDHDPKPKVGAHISQSDADKAKQELKEYRSRLIERILALPAAGAPEVFWDFTLRGDRPEIEWNETMVRDEGLSLERLMDIHNLTSRRLPANR